MRQRGANRPDVAHDVQLPVGVPLVVGNVLEAGVPRDADVVHEHVEAAEGRNRLVDDASGLTAERQIRRDMRLLADTGRVPPTTGDDSGSLGDKLPHDLATDAAGRAGDEAALPVKLEIHATTVSSLTTRIVLVRHGETDWNRDNRFQGHADPPLNDTGRAQASALAANLAGMALAAAYTSPLRRARETAEVLGAALALTPVDDSSLMEIDVGSWSGLTRTQIEERFPAGFARWLEGRHGWDDGETNDELGARVVAGLLEIGTRHPDAAVLAVTHGGPIRSALAAAERIPFDGAYGSIHGIGNCTVVELAVREGALERLD